jgi:hypothetical protein
MAHEIVRSLTKLINTTSNKLSCPIRRESVSLKATRPPKFKRGTQNKCISRKTDYLLLTRNSHHVTPRDLMTRGCEWLAPYHLTSTWPQKTVSNTTCHTRLLHRQHLNLITDDYTPECKTKSCWNIPSILLLEHNQIIKITQGS